MTASDIMDEKLRTDFLDGPPPPGVPPRDDTSECPDDTAAVQEVAPLFRVPFLQTGYRHPGQPWSYYFRSVFQVHNETGNIWTHLVAALIFTDLTYRYGRKLDYQNETRAIGLLGFGVCSISYALLATFTHIIHRKSEEIHLASCQLYYIGTGLLCHAWAILFYHCAGTQRFYMQFKKQFLPIHSCLVFATFVIFSLFKFKYGSRYSPTRKLLAFAAGAFPVFHALIPLFYRLQDCYQTSCSDMEQYADVAVWLALILACYMFCLPERWFPGVFDLIGHGSQLVGVFACYCTIHLFHAGHRDLVVQKVVKDAASTNIMAFTSSILLIVIPCASYILLGPRPDQKTEPEPDDESEPEDM